MTDLPPVRNVTLEQALRDNPTAVEDAVVRLRGRMHLDDLFPGDTYAALRQQIVMTGEVMSKTANKKTLVKTRPLENGKHEVVAIAAVSRDPGRSDDYLSLVQDYEPQTQILTNRETQINQYWAIYKREGPVNNAINKIASILSAGGRFKVRRARRGKKQKQKEEAQQLLDFFYYNVNGIYTEGVITGDRGIRSVMHAAVRQALVEGDWVARHVWGQVEIPGLGSRYAMPTTLQAISMRYLEPVKELYGFGELWYYKPPSDLIRMVNSENKAIRDVVMKLLDRKFIRDLQNSGNKLLLDPMFLSHVKHRGQVNEPYGESLIEPSKGALRYMRGLFHTDMVTMENIINRLTIVSVGSDDPNSPYSKADVAMARAALMQELFEDPGPNMTVIWQGNDVKVEDVGSQNAVLQIDGRYDIATNYLKMSLGVPDALLSGTTTDGKSSGWASVLGAAAQMEELANNFANSFRTLADRILFENGFEDFEVIYEYDQSLLKDQTVERSQNRSDYVAGGLSIRSYVAGTGRDPDAEYVQRCEERGLEPGVATWEEAFAPPQGLQGQGDGKVPGEGRPSNTVSGNPAAPSRERTTPTENR